MYHIIGSEQAQRKVLNDQYVFEEVNVTEPLLYLNVALILNTQMHLPQVCNELVNLQNAIIYQFISTLVLSIWGLNSIDSRAPTKEGSEPTP